MRRLNLLYLAGLVVVALSMARPSPALAVNYGDYLSTITVSSPNEPLNQPAKVAVDQANGDVYVTDSGNKKVKKFDKNGNYVAAFSLTVAGTPVGIAVNGNYILVGDSTNKCVWIYNKSGALADMSGTGTSHKLGGASGTVLTMPNTIVFAPSTHIFVVDGDSDTVRIYSATGMLNSSFGTSGSGTSVGTTIYCYYPSGIAMANSTVSGTSVTQYFYIGDQGNYRVQKLHYVYDSSTKAITTAPTFDQNVGSTPGTRGDAFGSFLRISDLAWDRNLSRLVVIDSLQMVGQIFASDSPYTNALNACKDASNNVALNYCVSAVAGNLDVPTGAAIDLANQKIYVANNQGDSIASFNAQEGIAPTLSIDSPAALNTAATNPYTINYTAGDADSTATLYLFYDTDNAWSGGSKSITPGAGEHLIGTASIVQGTPAAATFSWNMLYATPGTYYVRGVAVDASGNSVESYSAGTIVIPDSNGNGLNDFFEAAYPTCTDPNSDCDGDGLTNLQEQQYGTNPTLRDTDGGGISDGVEVAKGTNPLDPSDDMSIPVDKYGTWFTDNVSNLSTYYVIKNIGDIQDIVDVTFDEWRGAHPNPPYLLNTTTFVIPPHGYVRFLPRTYTTMQYGSIYVRSAKGTAVGYMDLLNEGSGVTDASQIESICYLQDPSESSNANLYVPYVFDQASNVNRTSIALKNLDNVNTSTGTRSFTDWPNGTTTQAWVENIPASMTDVFRPSWMTNPTYSQTYSSAQIPRTSSSTLIGQVLLLRGDLSDRATYAMPTQNRTVFYLPFFKDKVDDNMVIDPNDAHWRFNFAVENTTPIQASGQITVYSTNGTVLGTYPQTINAGATTIFRPTWLNAAFAGTGWVKFEWLTGQGVGYQFVNYFWGNGTSDAASMDDRVSSRLVLARYIDNVNSYRTYVSILNTSATPVAVTATYRDAAGNVLGTPATINIGALSCVNFRPTDYNTATQGSIEFTTSVPSLVGTWQQIKDEEPFTDQNANNKWDAGEPYTDTNGDGVYTPRMSGMDNLLPY